MNVRVGRILTFVGLLSAGAICYLAFFPRMRHAEVRQIPNHRSDVSVRLITRAEQPYLEITNLSRRPRRANRNCAELRWPEPIASYHPSAIADPDLMLHNYKVLGYREYLEVPVRTSRQIDRADLVSLAGTYRCQIEYEDFSDDPADAYVGDFGKIEGPPITVTIDWSGEVEIR